ncbi:cytochrome c [Mucilaginibacter sp. dw_454]|uniref:c-type cytochrome n=1 Tax=Mucilaginibacter sp. dw_454 TaxID=2720079 RepID=UPI001BD20632|nr:cytochrome c [Mucilaginibacter sp. dw_454]
MKIKVISVLCVLLAILIYSCQNEDDITFKRYYTTGSLVYQSHCQNCHGNDGLGLSALMPPLTDTAFLRKNKTSLACFIKYGLKDKILIVDKRSYDNDMPLTDLAPIEIAEVLTYVANSFGNNQGLITSQKVEADLAECK